METATPPSLGFTLLNLGFISFALGAVGIFHRMPNIGLPTRRRAYVWAGFGLVLMAVGIPLL